MQLSHNYSKIEPLNNRTLLNHLNKYAYLNVKTWFQRLSLKHLNSKVTWYRHFTHVYLFGITRLTYTRQRHKNCLYINILLYQFSWSGRTWYSFFTTWNLLFSWFHRVSSHFQFISTVTTFKSVVNGRTVGVFCEDGS